MLYRKQIIVSLILIGWENFRMTSLAELFTRFKKNSGLKTNVWGHLVFVFVLFLHIINRDQTI